METDGVIDQIQERIIIDLGGCDSNSSDAEQEEQIEDDLSGIQELL